jgi:hypothetical protein
MHFKEIGKARNPINKRERIVIPPPPTLMD